MEVLDIHQLIGGVTKYDKKGALEVKKPKSWCKSVSTLPMVLVADRHLGYC